MCFIAAQQGGSLNGWFDVVTQLVRTKQLLSTRSTPFRHPSLQIPGFSIAAYDTVTRKLLGNHSSNDNISFWALRRTPRNEVADACMQAKKGTFKTSFHSILDSLYALPLITLNGAKVHHEIDKVGGKGIGTLKLSLGIQREQKKGRTDDFCMLNLVLGTAETGKLLACKEVPISQRGNWTMEQELQFEWKTANVYGGLEGGHVVLRLLLDSARGLDSEMAIRLK